MIDPGIATEATAAPAAHAAVSGRHGWSTGLLAWYDSYKRDFPWRKNPTPYHTWVCEVMSQQTTMAVVVPRFVEFVRTLPRVEDLAACDEGTLRSLWAGLGYYARARNLRKGAEYIVHERGGAFPAGYQEWLQVPGVGPYTASVIASITGGEPVACVDGNVIRVAGRLLARSEVKSVWSVEGQRAIQLFVQEELTGSELARARPGDFNQALMELGATVCTKASPSCLHCPVQRACLAAARGIVDACPPAKPRKDSTELSLLALCVVRFEEGGEGRPTHVALAERGKGFLRGTLGFPLVDAKHHPGHDGLEALSRLVGVPLLESDTFTHGITHHAITGRAAIARVASGAGAGSSSGSDASVGAVPRRMASPTSGLAATESATTALEALGVASFRWVELGDVEAALSSSLDKKAWSRALSTFGHPARP